jgi:hypothetical protein
MIHFRSFPLSSLHRLSAVAALAIVAVSCASSRLQVQIIDAATLSLDDETLSWSEFRARVVERVRSARERDAPPPSVVIRVDPNLAPRLGSDAGNEPMNRLVDLLQEAGIREVFVGR